MYDTKLTRISLPDDEKYIYTLGVAISVFLSLNGFVIENILHIDATKSWYDLIDKTSGSLLNDIENTIEKTTNYEIKNAFQDCIAMRNRILHGFRYTNTNGRQAIATKDKYGKQFYIDINYLNDFINKCNNLYDKLLTFKISQE